MSIRLLSFTHDAKETMDYRLYYPVMQTSLGVMLCRLMPRLQQLVEVDDGAAALITLPTPSRALRQYWEENQDIDANGLPVFEEEKWVHELDLVTHYVLVEVIPALYPSWDAYNEELGEKLRDHNLIPVEAVSHEKK